MVRLGFVHRARQLPLGARICCLLEGEEDVSEKEAAFWSADADVFTLTYRTRRPEALYFPQSLLAEGRNYLFAACALWELQLGQRASTHLHSCSTWQTMTWLGGWTKSLLEDRSQATFTTSFWMPTPLLKTGSRPGATS